MRLTERFDVITAVDKSGIEYHSKGIKLKQGADEKLCQLEDIEEELGIDLITLFNVFHCNEIIELIGGTFQNGVFIYHKSFYLSVDMNKKCVWDSGFGTPLMFKDYGKTWALTSEELL